MLTAPNDFVCSEKHSTKVTGHMLDIMTPLISEADSVSQDLLDVMLGCILEPFKVTVCVIMLMCIFFNLALFGASELVTLCRVDVSVFKNNYIYKFSFLLKSTITRCVCV